MRDPMRFVRAALLLGFALLIGKLLLSGEMAKYMSPSLDPLTALTGLVLGAMGIVELRGGGPPEGHAHSPEQVDEALASLLLLLPVVLALVFVPRSLSTGALGGERLDGMLLTYASSPTPSSGLTPGGTSSGLTLGTPPPPRRPIADVDDLLAYVVQTGEAGLGQRVRVRGIVARSDTFRDDELALLRFSIAHCVADARPVALLVVAGRAPGVTIDQWVEIDGTLDRRERDGDRLISIVAETIVPIAEPDNPYLSAL
jgi:putative membrane protein